MVGTTLDQQAKQSEMWQSALNQGITNKRDFRRQQNQLSNTPLTDTQRATSAGENVRYAGFKQVQNVPQADEDTQAFIKPYSGQYTGADNQDRFGYYGDINPYTQEGVDTIAKNYGYEKLGKGIDTSYVGYIPDLAENLFQLKGYDTDKNLYAKGGHDPRNIGITPGISLEDSFRKLWQDKVANNYTTFKYGPASQEVQHPVNDFTFTPPLEQKTGYRFNEYDYADLGALQAAQNSQLNYFLSDPNITRNAYLNLSSGRALGQNAGQIGHTTMYQPAWTSSGGGGGEGQSWDSGGDTFELGYNDPNKANTRSGPLGLRFGSRQSPEDALKNRFGNIYEGTITDSSILKTLFGGGDLMYNGKDYGDIYSDPGKTFTENKWDDSWEKTKKNLVSKKTYGEVKGGQNFLASMYDLGYNTPQGYFSPTGYTTQAQFSGDDQRYNQSYSQRSLSGLGKILGAALNFIPYVGPMASAVFSGANNKGSMTNNITGESQQWGGVSPGKVIASGIGGVVGGIPGLSEGIGQAVGLKGAAANAFGNALIHMGATTAGGLVSGQGFGDALKGGAMAGLGAGGGSLLQGALGGQLNDLFGNTAGGQAATNILSRTLSNAGTTALQQMLTGNKNGTAMGLAALQGALSGAGGTLGSMFGETPAQREQYANLGSKVGNVGGNLIKQNKLANIPRRV